MKFPRSFEKYLICPETKSKLVKDGKFFYSTANPSISYPIIDDIPILICDRKSLFSIKDFQSKSNTTWNLNPNRLYDFIKLFVPSIGLNLRAKKNYQNLARLLRNGSKILIVGGSVKGAGIDPIFSNKTYKIINLDVSFGNHTNIIADSHDIPFNDGVFDCVIIQAVLEHVLDPYKCVGEIYRVLKSSGIVYAETPFMQQVHMGKYDFTRFTHLGHRRLFRWFAEIEHAPLMGPGTSLAWAYTHFLTSFTSSKYLSLLIKIFAHYTSFFLKYFDWYIINKSGAYDAASAYFFLGKKSKKELSDKELIKGYKGKIS